MNRIQCENRRGIVINEAGVVRVMIDGMRFDVSMDEQMLVAMVFGLVDVFRRREGNAPNRQREHDTENAS